VSAAPRSAGWSLAQLAVLVGAAAILAAPFLMFGALPGHSTIYNITWTSQFVAAVADGTAYPRWLPDSFAGLGSPAFFFYAPLPFYWTWLHAPLGVTPEGTFRLLGVSMATMLLASGLTMRLWLGRHAGARAATTGAVAYMAMPYHLFDLYQRASLGELAAYAVVPLVAIGVSRLARDGARGVVPLAVAAAALLLAHLPTSLGAAFLLAAQLLSEARRAAPGPRALAGRLAWAAAAGLLAAGLAAAYLLPALTLGQHTSLHIMRAEFYDPRVWLLTSPGGWPNVLVLVVIASVALAILAMAGLAWRWAAPGTPARWWAAASGAIVLALSGVVPGLWEPWSPLAVVQFPWRLLLLAEFAVITAAVMAAGSVTITRAHFLPIWLVALLATPAITAITGATIVHLRYVATPAWDVSRLRTVALRPDALEYMPNGTTSGYGEDGGIDQAEFDAMLALLAPGTSAWAEPQAAAAVAVALRPGGELDITVHAVADARIVLRRFHFPTWRLETAAGAAGPLLEPHGPGRLESFRVPPGDHRLRLLWSPPPIVTLAEAVSLASILVVFVLLAPALRRVPRTRPPAG
jgi:hypothetical protein